MSNNLFDKKRILYEILKKCRNSPHSKFDKFTNEKIITKQKLIQYANRFIPKDNENTVLSRDTTDIICIKIKKFLSTKSLDNNDKKSCEIYIEENY
jgi:hypothetical protein